MAGQASDSDMNNNMNNRRYPLLAANELLPCAQKPVAP